MTVCGHSVAFNHEITSQSHCVGEDSDAVALRFRIRNVEFNGFHFVESSHRPELDPLRKGLMPDRARRQIVLL